MIYSGCRGNKWMGTFEWCHMVEWTRIFSVNMEYFLNGGIIYSLCRGNKWMWTLMMWRGWMNNELWYLSKQRDYWFLGFIFNYSCERGEGGGMLCQFSIIWKGESDCFRTWGSYKKRNVYVILSLAEYSGREALLHIALNNMTLKLRSYPKIYENWVKREKLVKLFSLCLYGHVYAYMSFALSEWAHMVCFDVC